MNIRAFLKNYKLNFWSYQLFGWSIYIVNEVMTSLDFFAKTKNAIPYLIIAFAVFFAETIGLRYIYRFFYNLRKSPLLYILLISVISIMCSFIMREILMMIEPLLFDCVPPWIERMRNIKYFGAIFLSAWLPFVWSILYFVIRYWQELQNEIQKSKNLQLQTVKAQLKMLRYQLNPHFLFNSLNSIQSLMYSDVKKADLMLTELSEFLRYSLKHNNDIFIPLKEEFEIMEKYLFVEKIRFSEKLHYAIDFPSTIGNAKILSFLTQPLIENAVKYGMKSNQNGITHIVIEAQKVFDMLQITIKNNGTWIEKEETGTGIQNTKERLQNAYSSHCSFHIAHNEELVSVELKIPYDE
jgi:two-component system, LytTR family, sensor kinase